MNGSFLMRTIRSASARNDEEIRQLKLFSCSVAGCNLRREIEERNGKA